MAAIQVGRDQAYPAYQARPVRFLQLWAENSWRLKLYGIAALAALPRPELVRAATTLAADSLPRPATADGQAGVGFLTVHDGLDSTWVLLDWWADGNLLFHRLFGGSLDDPARLSPVTGGLTACTWELAVIGFERDAWLKHVYAADRPDIDGYLDARLEADI